MIDCAQFSNAIVAAGLMSADEVQEFWISSARLPDGASFGRYLSERGRLTAFQVESLLAGNETPLVLGDYVILNRIGTGGMGQVFQAQQRHLKRVAAIKLLSPALGKDEAAIKRFQREAQATARLSHPNIVQTYDAGVQANVWYLAMEFVDGRDLERVVAADGPLSVALAIDYVRQAAVGLSFAHENGVIHRDVKPANLLLDRKGIVKILDLGLARFTEAPEGGLTASDCVMGTVDYLAPEQARDTRSADARADIYSLGCTLYRLLTNQSIFRGDSLAQKLLAHQQQPIPQLDNERRDVPEALAALFARMVAKNPSDRPQSMHEVAATLSSLAVPAELAPTVVLNNFGLTSDQGLSRVSSLFFKSRRYSLLIIGAVAFVVALGIAIWGRIPPSAWQRSLQSENQATIPVPPAGSAKLVDEQEPTNYPAAAGLLIRRDASVDLSAVTFDGSHDLTIEGWFKTTSREHCEYFRFEPDGPVVFSTPKGDSGDIAAEWTDQNGQAVYAVCQQVLRDGELQHLALAYRNSSMLLFVDGVPIAESAVATKVGPERRLKLGNGHLELHALRISDDERYRGKFKPERTLDKDSRTLALFRCDVAVPNVLLDSSGHNRHGKIRGTEWLAVP